MLQNLFFRRTPKTSQCVAFVVIPITVIVFSLRRRDQSIAIVVAVIPLVSKLSLASSSPRVLHRAVFKKINLLNFIWRCGVGRNQRRRRRSDDECSRCFGTRGRLGGYDDSGRRKAAERAARLALEEWMKSYPLTVAQGAASRRCLLTPTTQFGNDGPLLSSREPETKQLGSVVER